MNRKRKILSLIATAFWLFNLSLYWMWMQGPDYYSAARAAGWTWYTCQEWGDDGHLHPSTACVAPAPLEPDGLQ